MAQLQQRAPRRRLRGEEKLARDRDIVSRYVVDRQAQPVIAAAHGITQPMVSKILASYGVGIDPFARIGLHSQARWHEGRQRKGGRPHGTTVWPDCPPELSRIYDKLGRHFGKGEARRLLEEPRR